MRAKITEEVIGKWPGVLAALGVEKAYLTNRHGPCPLCEGGKDRFRFDDKNGRGTFYCSNCGAGDGWSMLQKLKGWDFKQSAREVEAIIGTANVVPIRRGPSEADVRRDMNAIWASGKPVQAVREIREWWTLRTGQMPASGDLRAVQRLSAGNEGSFAAMVALVRGADGKPVNLHRTFIGADGRKAPIESPRRVMPIDLPSGCAVRLADPKPVMGVAEGIETAESASILFDMPVWACLTANNLERFNPPDDVQELVVFGDNDSNFVGQSAAYALVRRMRLSKRQCRPELPENEGSDWNDILLARMGV